MDYGAGQLKSDTALSGGIWNMSGSGSMCAYQELSASQYAGDKSIASGCNAAVQVLTMIGGE